MNNPPLGDTANDDDQPRAPESMRPASGRPRRKGAAGATRAGGKGATELPIRVLLEKLKTKQITGKRLRKSDRVRCVAYLTDEGCSAAEIAEMLGLDERTIYRHRGETKSQRALHAGPEFTAEVAGELIHHRRLRIERLSRVSRASGTPASIKVLAEQLGWTMFAESIRLLQSMGYVYRAPSEAQVHGHLTHRLPPTPQYDELISEVKRVECVVLERPAPAAAGAGSTGHTRRAAPTPQAVATAHPTAAGLAGAPLRKEPRDAGR